MSNNVNETNSKIDVSVSESSETSTEKTKEERNCFFDSNNYSGNSYYFDNFIQ